MSEPSQIIDWGCCLDVTYDEDFMLCTICSKAYHLACLRSISVDATTYDFRESSFVCPVCASRPKGGNNDNTPLRSCTNITVRPSKRVALNSPPSTDSTLTRDDVGSIVKEILHAEMENLFIRLSQQIRSSINSELAPIRKELSELKGSVANVNKLCDDVIAKQNCIAQEVKDLQTENASLRSENQVLVSKINQLEQFARGSNIEIQCIPEKNNENVISIVENISQVINCEIRNEHILSCSRIAKLNPKSPRPRSIVVQFSSPRIRDTFLAASIKFNKTNLNNKLNTSHIGLSGEKSPIFVVEHLSASNKALHAAARAAAKEKGYMFVWVRNGKIYMRKNETSVHKIIKSVESLKSLE